MDQGQLEEFREFARHAASAAAAAIMPHFRNSMAIEDKGSAFGFDPVTIADRNAAKRFINFIDAWYDRGRVLIVEAQAGPAKLYPVDHGTEAFEFDRTVSRLREMQGDDWLSSRDDL